MNTLENKKFIAFLERKNLSPNTIILYRTIIKILFSENKDIQNFIDLIKNNDLKASSQILYKVIVTQYYKFFKMEKELETLKFFKIKKPDMTYMKVIDKETIYNYCQELTTDSNEDKQIKTIIKFLFETGIRINEITTLKKENERLYVKGKGNKKRQIFYLSSTLNKLERFFPNLNINIHYIKILRTIKKFFGEDASCHTLRRSFATYMLTSGSNAKSVMLQMGHNDIKTTFKYINLNEKFNHDNYTKFFKETGE